MEEGKLCFVKSFLAVIIFLSKYFLKDMLVFNVVRLVVGRILCLKMFVCFGFLER